MGLLGLFTAPIRGTIWVAEQIQQEAERQYYDPGMIRRKLEEVADARAAGEISESEAADLEKQLVARLLEANRRPTQEESP